MKLTENKSQTWFKILTSEGKSIDGESVSWSLPKTEKGDWIRSPLLSGTCLVSNPKDFMQRTNRVFIAEFNTDPEIERPGVIWVRHVRLVREATNLDLKRFGIYRAFKQQT